MHPMQSTMAVVLAAALVLVADASSLHLRSQPDAITSLVGTAGCSLNQAAGLPQNWAIQLSLPTQHAQESPILCAGHKYNLQVELPETARVLLTTSTGSLEGASSSCPSQLSSNKAVSTLQTTLTVPCTAAGSLEVVAIAATGEGLSQNSLILDIDGSCLAASCFPSQKFRKLLDGDAMPTNSTDGGDGGDSGGDGGDMGGDGGDSEDEDLHYRLNHAHAALMIAAVIAMFPTGILVARHRRFLPERQLCGLDIWYWLHVGSQAIGWLCFLGGISIAFSNFGDGTGESLMWHAHYKLGITVFAMFCVQFLIAYFRPSHKSESRPMWNFIHSNWARICILAAWAEASLGVWVYNEHSAGDNDQTFAQAKAYKRYTIAMVILGFAVITAAIWLEILSLRTPVTKAEQQEIERKAKHIDTNHDATVAIKVGENGDKERT